MMLFSSIAFHEQQNKGTVNEPPHVIKYLLRTLQFAWQASKAVSAAAVAATTVASAEKSATPFGCDFLALVARHCSLASNESCPPAVAPINDPAIPFNFLRLISSTTSESTLTGYQHGMATAVLIEWALQYMMTVWRPFANCSGSSPRAWNHSDFLFLLKSTHPAASIGYCSACRFALSCREGISHFYFFFLHDHCIRLKTRCIWALKMQVFCHQFTSVSNDPW